jgi:quercetin dioxygenase-like cupin family protein
MTDAVAKHHRWQDVPREQLSATIGRRFITTDRVTLAQFELAAGAIVATHAHESEQITYITAGLLRLWLGSEDEQVFDVAAGEVLQIPSNVPHRAEAIEDTRATDVFCPRREDWLEGSDAYLRDE